MPDLSQLAAGLEQFLSVVYVFLEAFSRIFTGVIVATVSFYLAYRRLFHKIDISYSHVGTEFSEVRISNILLVNKKDRPEIIRRIEVVIDGDLRMLLKTFSPPIVLKPLECVLVDTDEVSQYLLQGKSINLVHFLEGRKVRFELLTESRVIVPRMKKVLAANSRTESRIVPSRTVYNGLTLTQSVVYAILYRRNGVHFTGFVHGSGLITGEWNYHVNMIPSEMLESRETVTAYLVQCGFYTFADPTDVRPMRLSETQHVNDSQEATPKE